jgi:anti-anti-sigma factor
MPTTFELVTADETHTHVRILGPLDVAGSTEVSLKFTAATAGRKRHVIVDMVHVDFVASLGLGMLVQVARSLTPEGKRVVLLKPSAAVAGVLRNAKLDAVLPIADSPETAIALIAMPRA